MQLRVETTHRKGERFPGGLLEVAEAFLNDQFGARYYGPGLRHIVLSFREKFPSGRAPKTVWRYKGSFAEHVFAEVAGADVRKSQLSAADFRQLMDRILDRVLSTRKLWQGAFQANDFVKDYAKVMAHAPHSDSDLRKYSSQIEQIRERGWMQVLCGQEEHRFQARRPCNVRFVGLRYYESKGLAGKFEPHLAIFTQLLEGLLRNLELLCPVYREIYFNVAESMDEARELHSAVEAWHENAYAVISLKGYKSASQEKRAQLVLNALADGLRDLARIDHLDLELIERAVSQIRQTGLDTDLKYLSAENKRHCGRVLYRVAPDGGAPYFRLEVQNKSDGRTGVVDLGRHDLFWLPYRFGRLVLSTKDVTIEARNSWRAEISLKMEKAPAKLRFSLSKIFGE